jgi:hypothetical protein
MITATVENPVQLRASRGERGAATAATPHSKTLRDGQGAPCFRQVLECRALQRFSWKKTVLNQDLI